MTSTEKLVLGLTGALVVGAIAKQTASRDARLLDIGPAELVALTIAAGFVAKFATG